MAEINTLEITDWNNPGRYCKACFDKRCILSANPFDIFGPAGGMCHATTLDSVLRAKSTNACIKHGPLNECLYQSWTMLDGGRAFGGFLKCRYVPPNHPNLDNFKNMLILKPMLYPWFWGSPHFKTPPYGARWLHLQRPTKSAASCHRLSGSPSGLEEELGTLQTYAGRLVTRRMIKID